VEAERAEDFVVRVGSSSCTFLHVATCINMHKKMQDLICCVFIQLGRLYRWIL
jgi:hypothetical protein